MFFVLHFFAGFRAVLPRLFLSEVWPANPGDEFQRASREHPKGASGVWTKRLWPAVANDIENASGRFNRLCEGSH